MSVKVIVDDTKLLGYSCSQAWLLRGKVLKTVRENQEIYIFDAFEGLQHRRCKLAVPMYNAVNVFDEAAFFTVFCNNVFYEVHGEASIHFQ